MVLGAREVARRLVLVTVLALSGTLALGALHSGAHAEVTEPSGRCNGSATFANGPKPSFTVTTGALDPTDVTTIRRSDTVEWRGGLTGVGRGRRAISGFVRLDLPWPIPDARIGRWSTSTDRSAQRGTKTYTLPGVTPRGVAFHLYGQHREAGALWCSGSTKVRLAGSRFGPLTLGALALLALSALLWMLAARAASPALGGVAGFLTLGSLAVTLVLLGILPLASPLVTILPVVGLAVGIIRGRIAMGRA